MLVQRSSRYTSGMSSALFRINIYRLSSVLTKRNNKTIQEYIDNLSRYIVYKLIAFVGDFVTFVQISTQTDRQTNVCPTYNTIYGLGFLNFLYLRGKLLKIDDVKA